jgi:WD40 repeat protein/energy-coupling factor transporter ATP-binding protein EcfA2
MDLLLLGTGKADATEGSCAGFTSRSVVLWEDPGSSGETSAMTTPKGPFESIDVFAEALVASYVDDPRFVPRPWLLNQVQAALDGAQARFVLLTGEPGSGKSALMAHLARLHAEWPRYFLRRDSMAPLQGGDPRTFLFAVGHQLAHLHPSLFDPRRLEVVVRQRAERIASGGQMIGIKVKDLQASPFYATALEVTQSGGALEGEMVGISAARVTLEPRLLELSNLQYLALLDPAEALFEQDPHARIVILLDALDEVRYGLRGENVLSWLASCPPLPANVQIVLTSRPDPDLLGSFRRAKASELQELTIDPEAEEDRDRIQEDLRQFLGRFSAEPAVARALKIHEVQPASFVDEARSRALGNFQYAVALARGIDQALATSPPAEDLPALLRLEEIPAGTTELYRFFLGRIKEEADRNPVQVAANPLAEPEDRRAWDWLYHPILAALAVAFEPLSPEQLQAYAAVPPESLPRAIEGLAQFLDIRQGRWYRLYHVTFPEFLTGESTAAADVPFHVDPGIWHGRLAGRLLRANPDWLSCQDRYALAYTPAHLTEAIRLQDNDRARQHVAAALTEVLANIEFLERKATVMGVDALLADLHPARLREYTGASRIADIGRLLNWEAHNFRRWDHTDSPEFFAQQLRNKAVEQSMAEIVGLADARLQALGQPYIALRWASARESTALERTMVGHRHGVTAVAVAADGRRIVSGSLDGTVRVWDLGTGTELRALSGGSEKVLAVAVTPNDREVIAGMSDGTFRAWSLETGLETTLWAADTRMVSAAAVASDCKRAVSALGWLSPSKYGTFWVWDLENGSQPVPRDLLDPPIERWGPEWVGRTRPGWGWLLRTLFGHMERTAALAIAAGGNLVAAVSSEGTLEAWDIDRAEFRTLSENSVPVQSVAIMPDGIHVLSGSRDGQIKLWDLLAGNEIATLAGASDGITALAVSPDGKQAVSGSEYGVITLWDLEQEAEPRTLDTHGQTVHTLAVTTDGRQVVSGAGGTIKLWNLMSETKPSFSPNARPVTATAVTPDGVRILMGRNDGTLELFDLASGTRLWRVPGHQGRVVTLSLVRPDGRQAVSVSLDGTIKLWDLETGAEVRTLIRREDEIWAAAVTSDGRRAVLDAPDHTFVVWDLENCCELGRLPGTLDMAVAAAITPDGRRVTSAGFEEQSSEQIVRVWDVESRKLIRTFPVPGAAVGAIAITSDGRRIAWEANGLWTGDLDSGESQRLPGPSDINALCFSSDESLIIAGALNGTLMILDHETGKVLANAAFAGGFMSVAAAPDSTSLVAGDRSGYVYYLRLVLPPRGQ